jgi:carboxylesterase
MELNLKSNVQNNAISDTIVLFHGLCSSPLELSFLATHLRSKGFLVETPTFEGYAHGTNSGTWEDWLTQAYAYVAKIRSERGGEISLGGLSLGCLIALGVCAKSKENFNSLCLLSPTLLFDGWATPWYRVLIPLGMALGLGDKFTVQETEPYGVKNLQLRAYLKRTLESQKISEIGGESFTLRHLSEANQLCRYIKKKLPQITTNCLIIHAIDDEISSVRSPELILNSISSTNKRVIFLGNSYHMITVDNERETVNEEVSNFFMNPGSNLNDPKVISQNYGFISPELQRYIKNLP